MIKTYRYRLYPTKRQVQILNSQLAICCELFNAGVQERRDAWRLNRISISFRSQSDQLPAIKTARPDLNGVYSQVLQDVLHRVDKTFQNFFRRVKDSKGKVGFPRFRPHGRYDSLTYPQKGFVVRDGKLRLSKIGSVRIKLHRPIEGQIRTLTIIRSSTGKWFACFSVEMETKTTSAVVAVGIDVGLTHFATLSTGEQIPNPRFFQEEQRALAKAQRRLSAEKVGTPKRKTRRRIVARVHERIRFRRNNFAHQLSRYLVNRFGIIVFEDLNIRGMVKNHCLAKSIADAAWNQLFQFTTYKAENAGGLCKQIDPRNTSRLTACCGELVDMTLDDRVIHCPKCHSSIDRDWNASLNILSRGLATLGIHSVEAPGFIRGGVITSLSSQPL